MSKEPVRTLTDGPEIQVGVSSCLLGHEVRYNGGHTRDRYVTDILAEHFSLLAVCPEVELGMGTPRETVRLVGTAEAPRMVGSASATDWTERMNRWSRRRARELEQENLCGYIFKKNSPTCGVFRVKVYQEKGTPPQKGRGLFAAEFARQHPLLPIEEEGRLNDPHLRENFIERVFALHRLKQVFAGRWKRGAIVDFHACEKYLLMAHDPQGLKLLGRRLAAVADETPTRFRERYMADFMAILSKTATVRKHVNTMQHIAGYLRDHLTDEERRRVLAVVEDFRQGLVPLIVPMTLIRHFIELHDVAYVNRQTYLNPHPRELMLRNHV